MHRCRLSPEYVDALPDNFRKLHYHSQYYLIITMAYLIKSIRHPLLASAVCADAFLRSVATQKPITSNRQPQPRLAVRKS